MYALRKASRKGLGLSYFAVFRNELVLIDKGRKQHCSVRFLVVATSCEFQKLSTFESLRRTKPNKDSVPAGSQYTSS